MKIPEKDIFQELFDEDIPEIFSKEDFYDIYSEEDFRINFEKQESFSETSVENFDELPEIILEEL
jgi:hypothetical protein